MKNECVGGNFNLPEKIIKLYKLATKNDNENEMISAKKTLLKRGWFLDKIGILWEKDNIPEFAKK